MLEEGINFAVFSRHATSAFIVIFLPGEEEPLLELPLEPDYHRTGDIWHILIRGINQDVEYGFRMDRDYNENPKIHRFDKRRVLLDPYAKAIVGGEKWGARDLCGKYVDRNNFKTGRRGKIIRDVFDWGFEKRSSLHLSDMIIYELHVRCFTVHNSSKVSVPGTYRGLIEKIPYLKDLGINAVELMPVAEFDEGDCGNIDPISGERLLNLWGYNPIGFFAPKASYAAGAEDYKQVHEFKEMVKAFHLAGIEVILDIVFNHTAEGNENGPMLSFRGIDNKAYYISDESTGSCMNYSGCGNTVNCNHPVVRDMLLDCLRYWVMEMHVDGFRFDLASILGRGQHGEVLPYPPIIERIAADPVLAGTKLIAEAWDAAGLYQVGQFPKWGRWAEWNGKFRDDIRKSVRGDCGMISDLMTRLAGSSDLYQVSRKEPSHSINFVTCHDGFTLHDLVSYNSKNNERNGENNRDGANDNYSWNCGTDGKTKSREINNLRKKQTKNFFSLLLISRGVPMILAGDEFCRTQEGNNNCYCQDNELSWIDWELLEKNHDIYRFCQKMIELRKNHPVLRYRKYLPNHATGEGEITWHGVKPRMPDTSHSSRSIAMMIQGGISDSDFYIAINFDDHTNTFEFPKSPSGKKWHLVADTSRSSPRDILDFGAEELLNNQRYIPVNPRSIIILKTSFKK